MFQTNNLSELNSWIDRFPTVALWRDQLEQSELWWKVRHSPKIVFALIVAMGLVVGLLSLGIMVWRANSLSSGQFPPAYERMYMTWVADRYAQSGNISQAQRDLQLWSKEDIVRVVTNMQAEPSDTESKRRVEMLAGALGIGVTSPTTSTRPSLFAQPIFLASMFLAVGLLLMGIGIIVVPMLRDRMTVVEERTATEEEIDANLEELLADVQIGTLGPEIEDKPEEKPEEKQEIAKTEETESEDANTSLGDLASLFEEEDTSLSALENFCKGLAEIKVEELSQLSTRVIQGFKGGQKS